MSNLEKAFAEQENSVVETKQQHEIVEQENKADFDSIQAKYLKKQVEEGKGISEIAEDFVKAGVTRDIVKDEQGKYSKFHEELAEEQKETLKESFKQDRVKKQAETLTAKQQKAEAFYISFRPILEFDFSPLIHKKENEQKTQKTYKDRSYGIPLMVLMLALFVVPYCAFSIILALFNGINAIFDAIATFGSTARVIATTIFILIICCLVIYCALLGIDSIFGTTIIRDIGIN